MYVESPCVHEATFLESDNKKQCNRWANQTHEQNDSANKTKQSHQAPTTKQTPRKISQHVLYFIMSSGLDSELGAGGPWATPDGAGARSGIGIDIDDFPPRVLLVPPRPEVPVPPPRPPRLSWEADAAKAAVAARSLPPSALLLPRGRREVPPREPGPRNGRPVSWETGTAAAIGTCGCEVTVRVRPVPRPRPRPRLIVPSALQIISKCAVRGQ